MDARLLIILILVPLAVAQECDNWQTEHPEWLQCEDFEDYAGDFIEWHDNTEWYAGEYEDRGRIDMTSNDKFQGNYSLYMPAASSSGYQGASLRWYDCVGDHVRPCEENINEEYYLRAYFKLASDHELVHHFLSLGASQPERDEFWDSMGLAGCRPNGALSAGSTVDFNEQRETHFYTYSIDMECDSRCDRYMDMQLKCDQCADKGLPCENGLECCWGNHYPEEPGPESVVPRDEWICMEMWMKLNTPEVHDGQMAYWINDELIHQENTMYWRIDPELGMNRARLQHYITTEDAGGHSNKIWWDNAVLSTERIGCLDYVPEDPPVQCTSADTSVDGVISAIEMQVFLASWFIGDVSTIGLFPVIDKWKNGC